MKNDSHLTVPNPDLERKVLSSFPGMAHFARTGPPNTCCRTCAFYGTHFEDANRVRFDKRCAKYIEMVGKLHYQGIPPSTPSCRHYQEATP